MKEIVIGAAAGAAAVLAVTSGLIQVGGPEPEVLALGQDYSTSALYQAAYDACGFYGEPGYGDEVLRQEAYDGAVPPITGVRWWEDGSYSLECDVLEEGFDPDAV